jgi:hypothetical protein
MDPRDQKDQAKPNRDFESIRAVYSALETVEPPDLVDQAVLNTARRELTTASKRRPLRWFGGLATASVVVLALTVVLQQEQRVPEVPIGDGIKLDAAAPAGPEDDSVTGQTGRTRTQKQEAGAEKHGAREDRPQMMKRSVAAPEEQPMESSEVTAPAPAAVAGDDYRVEEHPNRSQAQSMDEGLAPDTEADHAEALRTANREAVLAESEEKVAEDLPDPEEWLERLELLLRSELYEKFEMELAAFKAAYPDYPLPAEMQD